MHAATAALALHSAMHVVFAIPHTRAALQPAWQRSTGTAAGVVVELERRVSTMTTTIATMHMTPAIAMIHGVFEPLTGAS